MTAFNRGDIAQVNGAVRNICNDCVAKLVDALKLVKRAHKESLVTFLESTAGKVDVFSPDTIRNLVDADTELRKLLLVDTNLDFIFESTTDLHGSGTFLRFQVGFDAVFR